MAEHLPCFILNFTRRERGGIISFTIPEAFVKDNLRKIFVFFSFLESE